MIMEPTNNWKQFLELCFLHGGLRTYIYWRTINSIIALISLLVSVECTTKISNQLDELQHCQLLKNVAMNLVWLFQDRAVATRPKMEQLTGFSRLVSAHGVSRPNGTSTLENRRCTECLVLEAALSSSPTQNNSCLHQLLPPLPANSIANLAKHEAQQQCFPRYQPENAKLLAETSVCPVHLLPNYPP